MKTTGEDASAKPRWRVLLYMNGIMSVLKKSQLFQKVTLLLFTMLYAGTACEGGSMEVEEKYIVDPPYGGGLGFSYYHSNKEGSGPAFVNEWVSGSSVVIPESISYYCDEHPREAEWTKPVSFIGYGACREGGFRSLVIPSTIKPNTYFSTGDGYAFADCHNLTSVILGCNFIGKGWFLNCTSLASVDISNILSLGAEAFRGSGLEKVSLTRNHSSTVDASYRFADCHDLEQVELEDGITGIGGHDFENCTALKDITIPASVSYIGPAAFMGCTSLASAMVLGCSKAPDQWRKGIFKDCTSLKTVVIGDGVTALGEFMFQNCTNLESVTIGKGVTNLPDYVFSGCRNLKKIVVEGDSPTVGYGAYENIPSDYSCTIYVHYGSKGWGIDIPGKTKGGRNIVYIEDTGYYTPLNFTIEFDANGGSVSPCSKTVLFSRLYGTLPTPTWSGHDFLGWYTAKTGGTQVTASTRCTGNATLYARWKVKQYKISLNANGGSVSPTYKMVDYCKVYGMLPTPTWSSVHTFVGWFTAKTGGMQVTESTKCVGNATVYARWKIKQYKISFNANGGSVSPTYKMVDYCKTCDTFPTPTWGGHTFKGWFTARTGGTKVTAPWKCTGNKTIYAQWTVKQYKLTFNANGGTVSPAYKMVDYCKTCDTFPTPTWGGHTFNGWFTARSGGTKVTAPWKCTGNKTIYAQWKVKQYRITLDPNGGSVSPTYIMVDYCKPYLTLLPTPKRKEYYFMCWSFDKNDSVFSHRVSEGYVTMDTKCTGNVTIYAQWMWNSGSWHFGSYTGKSVSAQ